MDTVNITSFRLTVGKLFVSFEQIIDRVIFLNRLTIYLTKFIFQQLLTYFSTTFCQ